MPSLLFLPCMLLVLRAYEEATDRTERIVNNDNVIIELVLCLHYNFDAVGTSICSCFCDCVAWRARVWNYRC